MNSGQKTAVSLILTAGLFVAFVFTYYTNVFTKIETQFYEPERIKLERSRLTESSEFCDLYIQNLLETVGNGYVKEPSVKSFLSQTPSEGDVTARVQLSGELFTKLQGLDGFRLIDKNGRDMHYSSYAEDIVKQTGTTRVYRNFSEVQNIPGEMSFSAVSIPESENIQPLKVTFNSAKSQIILSFPVYDKYDVFRGVFVFYFKTSDLERELIKANQISLSDTLTLFSSEEGSSGGIVIGMPKVGRELFTEPVLQNWKSKSTGPDKIIEAEDNKYWVIISDYTSKYFSVSESYRSDYFELPDDTRILICICVFVTVFLVLFLLLSFKHDDMVIIRTRIKKIQFALISEYLENKQNVDWAQVSRQIEGRKTDLFNDVKKSLGHKGKKHSKEVDALLNKSWEEILSAVGNRQEYQASLSRSDASSAEIKRMLEEVLSTTQLKVQNVLPEPGQPAVKVPAAKSEPVPADELEDVESLDEAEPLEDAETLDEVEEVEEAESLDEVEEVEEAESLEEVEEVEEAESLDEVEEIEEAESLDEVEEISVDDFGLSDVEEESAKPNEDNPYVNSTFKAEYDNDFASVDDIFAERLELGLGYTEKEDVEDDENFEFEISTPDFGTAETIEPVTEDNMFVMTSFGDNAYVSDFTSEIEPDGTVVEVNGVFSISDNLEVNKVSMDRDFKKLVDSVLSV